MTYELYLARINIWIEFYIRQWSDYESVRWGVSCVNSQQSCMVQVWARGFQRGRKLCSGGDEIFFNFIYVEFGGVVRCCRWCDRFVLGFRIKVCYGFLELLSNEVWCWAEYGGDSLSYEGWGSVWVPDSCGVVYFSKLCCWSGVVLGKVRCWVILW